ncbi:hypothetical protein COD67_07945 [Bacillus cereus]|nr:hypothetical protein COI89_10090 [Bacillus cereus]PGU68077.1 hypothetical protein COD67_07945 [Bacillus cereus]
MDKTPTDYSFTLLVVQDIYGSVAKFLKLSYKLEIRSEENHEYDILKENSSRKTLFMKNC